VRVAITGASGLIGTALRRSLQGDGHDAVALARPGTPAFDAAPQALAGADAVVHLAGHPIGAKRWNAAEKARIIDSRAQGTAALAEALAGLPAADRPGVLVSGSGVNYYGDRGGEVLTETSGPGPAAESFLTRVVLAWEAGTQPAEAAGIRTCHIRTAMVLDRSAGGLGKMLPLFKLGLGGPFGRGRTWMPWIALEDEVGAIRFLLETASASGPFNLAAPNPVTNADFAKTLGRVLRRPAFMPVPPFGPKLLLGAELADDLLFTSMRAEPAALLAAGYVFRFPSLEGALRATLER
jgi:uncharacterized protein (TIGR01777 family)